MNAYATDFTVDLPDGRKLEPPAIMFLGGLAHRTPIDGGRCGREHAAGGGVSSTEGTPPSAGHFARWAAPSCSPEVHSTSKCWG